MVRRVAAPICVVLAWLACAGAGLSKEAGSPVADGWYPGELIFPERPSNFDPSQMLSAYREGVAPDGFHYAYFPDGSGSVWPAEGSETEGWSIDCTPGLYSDNRWECDLVSYESVVSVRMDGGTPLSVCAYFHELPDRRSIFQVDDSPPVSTDSAGCAPPSFLTRMLAGEQLTVTFYSEDSPDGETATGPLDLLPAVIDLLAYLKASIDDRKFE